MPEGYLQFFISFVIEELLQKVHYFRIKICELVMPHKFLDLTDKT